MSAAESEAVWNRIHELQQEQNNLRVDHAELRGALNLVVGKIDENRTVRDAQHAELVKSMTELNAHVTTLMTERTERDGASKAGRTVGVFIAGFAAFLLTIAGLIATAKEAFK